MFTHGDVSWLKMSSQGPDAMCSNSVTGSVDFVNCQTKVCMIITVLHKMEHKLHLLFLKKIYIYINQKECQKCFKIMFTASNCECLCCVNSELQTKNKKNENSQETQDSK